MTPVIPHFGLARQYTELREELLDATDNALKNGVLMNGRYTRDFEDWLEQKTRTNYAVTVHSGTQALEIIARYVSGMIMISELPKVMRVPNITYPATLNAMLTAGWEVELCDTDSFGIVDYSKYPREDFNTFNCYVGLYGRYPRQKNALDSNRSIVDGAQHWLVAGGDVGIGMAISFDPTKNLPSSGNGGAIVTNDIALYNFATRFRDNDKLSDFQNIGTNSRMSEQDCAQILVRAKYIDAWQARRQNIRWYYIDRFKNLPIKCLSDSQVPHADQKFVITSQDRNALRNYLRDRNVEAKVHYHDTLGDLQISDGFKKPDMLSTSVHLALMVLSLPIYPELTDAEVEYIADVVVNYHK